MKFKRPKSVYIKSSITMPSRCPKCKVMLDAATCLSTDEDFNPQPGRVTVCAYCGSVLIFGPSPGLKLRMATKVEAEYHLNTPLGKIVREVIGQVMAKNIARNN